MPKSEPQVEPLQEIHYRGQLARFRVPAHWTVEIDADNGDCFYDPDSPGTLRLNVLTFATPSTTRANFDVPHKEGRRVLETCALPSGCHMTVTETITAEDGEPLVLHTWRLGYQAGSLVHVYVFTYSYGLPLEAVQDELQLLDREIRLMHPAPATDV
ncbi:hypothetical protein U2F26_15870 [Micromonospora sp. 4G57]|uniref:SRPBCC family protein n=1 Tax=Micromonospora sicca TaxID=2202420 RepID=A0ABU5JA36_9ACTN|nr:MULTISPECIES: hypothetical protein [unclassified Micromonospora]MDZ5444198.1 hypothetical protein [Micromonospora sp. 4G57]MDZ5489448.1 hypothetical protein [Micromonospora sp. 4G53]